MDIGSSSADLSERDRSQAASKEEDTQQDEAAFFRLEGIDLRVLKPLEEGPIRPLRPPLSTWQVHEVQVPQPRTFRGPGALHVLRRRTATDHALEAVRDVERPSDEEVTLLGLVSRLQAILYVAARPHHVGTWRQWEDN